MQYERRARCDLTRYLWRIIKRQKPHIATEYLIVKSLVDEGVVRTKVEAEALINDVVEDGLVEIVKRNPRKYQIPDDNDFTIASLTYDLYCYECHTPNNLRNCSSSSCFRVFHEECRRNALLTTPQANRTDTRESEIVPTTQPPDESLIAQLANIRESFGDDGDDGEGKPRISRRNTEFSQFHENKEDVICIGQVRAPNRKRIPSLNDKINVNIIVNRSENEDYLMLCSSCQLKRSFENRDPPLEPEELNYLLLFLFTRIKTWILADTYPPLASSIPMSKKQFHIYEKIFLKFPTRLADIDENLKLRKYKKTTELHCDIMDIKHSVGVLYGTHSLEYEATTFLVNDCARELSELRKCFDCYRHSNEKCNKLWFCKPCVPRHELVFAKQRGFSHWPAKIIQLEEDCYDVRFFGHPHQRAKVSSKNVLPIDTDLVTLKVKETSAFMDAMNELRIHQELIELPPGSFSFDTERKSPLDTSNTLYFMQLQINKKSGRDKRKKMQHDSLSQEDDGQISPFPFSLTTPSISPDLEYLSQTVKSKPKRKRKNTTAAESIRTPKRPLRPRKLSTSLKSSNQQKKQVGGESDERISRSLMRCTTPLKTSSPVQQGQVSRRKSILPNWKYTGTKRLNPRVILTPFRSPSPQNGAAEAMIEENSVQQTTTNSKARTKPALAKSPQDIVETLRQQLIDKKCSRVACEIATKTLQKVVEQHNETMQKVVDQHSEAMRKLMDRHYRQIAANKRRQWCCLCGKEADRNCCWNTSYCSAECRNMHWQEGHSKTCSRSAKR